MTTKNNLPDIEESKAVLTQSAPVGMRDGIEIEKGVVVNDMFMKKNFKNMCSIFSLFSVYPDLFLDLITPTNSGIKLFFYQRIFLRAAMRYKKVYITACLKPGTPVLTEYGMVPIEKVNPNWKIWTKDGWIQPENLNAQNWDGEYRKIFAQNCLEDNIEVTDNHRFYIVPRQNVNTRPGRFWKSGISLFNVEDFPDRKEFYRKALREVEPIWVEAKDLKENDWLLSYIDTKLQDIESIEVPPIPNGHCLNIISNKNIILNNEFYEWLGIWLAEGSWNEKNSSVSFTININEARLKQRIIYLTNQIFGLGCCEYERLEKNTLVLSINSKHLCCFMEKLFECKAEDINQYNKFIPPSLLHCAPSKQLQLVKGWLDGDGYYRDTYGRDYKGVTVSSLLREGIKLILYRNWINPTILTEIRPNKAKAYNIVFGGGAAEEFEKAINEGRWVNINNSMRQSDYFPLKVGNDLFMRNRVKKIETLPSDNGLVYCLQMPNETFNVAGVEGHNCRAWSKSFLTILALFLQCIFIPGRKVFICAPNKSQGAQIAREKITEIYRIWPILKREVIGWEINDIPGNFGKDYVTLKFRNGSQFDVVGALESTLGGRRHGGLLDEIKNHDEDSINTIVLPLLNVSRRTSTGEVNPKEPNQQVLCATSAWLKTSFAYSKLIDFFELSIIFPKQAFVFGCDYRVPMLHGLIARDYINELKTSPSFKEVSFATEYMSIWQGASADSWFNFDKLNKHRKIKNPETHAKYVGQKGIFYLLSADIGRLHDQTVVSVFRVNIGEDGVFRSTLVNVIVLGKTAETKTFYRQAIDLKKIIAAFNPREVVIDTNGLGIGFGEEMTRTQIDPETGETLPSYGFVNDDDFKKIQPHDCIKILYGLKANSVLKPKIQSNSYTQINSGRVQFLISEQEAKSALLATKKGAKLSPEKKVKRLMPHEMTTRLFDEMLNLRLKKTTGTEIVLEPINSHYPDDKYYSFAYGLWRIKELEDEHSSSKKRTGLKRKLTFFN